MTPLRGSILHAETQYYRSGLFKKLTEAGRWPIGSDADRDCAAGGVVTHKQVSPAPQ